MEPELACLERPGLKFGAWYQGRRLLLSNPGLKAGDGDKYPQVSLVEALKCLDQ